MEERLWSEIFSTPRYVIIQEEVPLYDGPMYRPQPEVRRATPYQPFQKKHPKKHRKKKTHKTAHSPK
jgi:hypothetical protein